MSTIAIIAGTAVIALPFGFLLCAMLTAGKVSDAMDTGVMRRDANGNVFPATARELFDVAERKDRQLDAIRDLLNTPRTIRKGELASILDGDV